MIHEIEAPGGMVLILETAMGWCGALWGPGGLGRVILPESELQSVRDKLGIGATGNPFSRDEPAPSDRGGDAWRQRAARGLADLERDLQAYFAGRAVAFSASLDASGLSRFDKEIYAVAKKIPYGEVRTYQGVAREAGRPGAARAVGGAMARNPCPLVVPCHRVVRSDGGMGGFSAPCGIDLKRRLLEMEGIWFRGSGIRGKEKTGADLCVLP